MRRWVAVGVLVLPATLAAAIGYVFHSPRAETKPLGRSPPPAASVVVATAERRDVPVALKGIGIVQAYNTVTVKPRISGQIMQVVFTEGQQVHTGDVLVRIDSRFLVAQLHQAEATRAKDEAQLANAKRDLVRLTDVSVKGFVSQQLVDGQRAQVATLEAAVQADEAAIENTRVQLDYATVTAPIDGMTGIRMADVGNVISPSDPGIVVITQIKPIAVIFTLPAEMLAAMALGQAAGPTPVEVFDRDDKTRLATGRLALVDNQIDRTTNTARLKAVFDNTDNTLRPGEFVNAHLLKTVLRGATVVAQGVVQYNEQGAFAWLVRPDRTVEPRRIVIGPASGASIVIEGGLTPGDQVVLDGQYNLHPGAPVQLQARSATASGGGGNALSVP
ncbi:MAG: efflux transporter periplasmic adaptor subunit [Gammaproteobacteria bacterium]|jgi:multidrug efflux system membrane fusion protein|nr:efflux transporter periplasmic adaptor subunit [Gammaproteobacteria bacterium]